MSGVRARPPLLRLIVVMLAVGFGAVGFAGGLWSTAPAEPTVQAFLLDWEQGSYAAAAALTTGKPAAVAAELHNAFRGLDAAAFYLSMGPIRQHGDRAWARFFASVDLGQDGAPWNYQGRFSLRQSGSGWKIAWNPSVINPGLRAGLHLAIISSTPQRAPLLDSSGASLLTASLAYVVGVRPDRLAHPDATARLLGQATGLQPAELRGWILAAPRNRFQELVTLRPAQYARMARKLRRTPGLRIRPTRLHLFTSIAPAVVGAVGTEVSATLRAQGIAYRPGVTVGLSGLQQAYQRQLTGTPTTKVITEDAADHEVSVLATWNGSAPVAVRTTISPGTQEAAANAAASAPGSAAVVAMQASTGRILAVAEHTSRGLPEIDPLAGSYQPGAAFTIVSAEALLASREDDRSLAPNTPVPCRSVNQVGGRMFHNVPPVRGLGAQATFALDFTHACATAFTGLSEGLTARDLNEAASGFGIGGSWRLPLPSFAGSAVASGGVAQVAADAIGLGSVRMSPLALAMVAAEVDTGEWHQPSLVVRPQDPVRERRVPFSTPTLDTLRSLLRETVSSGAATQADHLSGPPVRGQVGTAALRSGKHRRWACWFVGYRGDVAFAVLEITSSPATSSVPVGARFLAAAPFQG